ncbi:unnamed protein product [Trichogramma brassicae]|uniref:DUF4780 domain-containing protein n=1 Tax=Trichogramma brassicae TaxID=86971 RepID=A0A6H5J2H5_9HYME|nr:unnamed protein product [Trichogramma brassicae]
MEKSIYKYDTTLTTWFELNKIYEKARKIKIECQKLRGSGKIKLEIEESWDASRGIKLYQASASRQRRHGSLPRHRVGDTRNAKTHIMQCESDIAGAEATVAEGGTPKETSLTVPDADALTIIPIITIKTKLIHCIPCIGSEHLHLLCNILNNISHNLIITNVLEEVFTGARLVTRCTRSTECGLTLVTQSVKTKNKENSRRRFRRGQIGDLVHQVDGMEKSNEFAKQTLWQREVKLSGSQRRKLAPYRGSEPVPVDKVAPPGPKAPNGAQMSKTLPKEETPGPRGQKRRKGSGDTPPVGAPASRRRCTDESISAASVVDPLTRAIVADNYPDDPITRTQWLLLHEAVMGKMDKIAGQSLPEFGEPLFWRGTVIVVAKNVFSRDWMEGHCHGHLRYHGHKIGLVSDSTCRWCGADEEMPLHLLTACDAAAERRRKWFGDALPSLEDIRGTKASRLIGFWREVVRTN